MTDNAVRRFEVAAIEDVLAWVHEDFGLDLTVLDGVTHGADEAAQLWRGSGTDSATYAVKLTSGGTTAGLVLPDHLARQGVPGIVAPVPTSSRRLWSERAGRRLSVVPWIPDGRALDGGMAATHWRAYGALLSSVHGTPVTDSLAAHIPREHFTHERAASVVRYVDGRVHGLGDGRAADDEIAGALAEEWRAASDSVLTILAHADDMSRDLRARPAATVISHGDPHLGNILRGSDDRVWLLDWDDAILSPPERDLMFVVGGVLAFAPVTPQQQSAFFDGYGAVEIDPVRLAYYMCTRALEDVASFAAQVIDLDRWTNEERAWALSIVRGNLSATGLITLALAALRDLGRIPERPADTSPTARG